MKSTEVEGNSVDEAVNAALKQLGVQQDQVEIEILETGSKGFFGFLSKHARVRVIVKETPFSIINDFVSELKEAMGLDLCFELKEDEPYWKLNFVGPDVRILIGRRGETLNSLQMIINMVVSKKLDQRIRVVIDAEDYRERREETLQRLAKRVSDQVRRYHKNVALEPMSPQERRIIHLILQEDPLIYTMSEGYDPYRHIVVCLKR